MLNSRAILLLAALTLAPVAPLVAAQNAPAAECAPDAPATTEQVTVEYATGFTVDYFDGYKVVTVTQPWADAAADGEAFQYVLVDCGVDAPAGFDDAQIVGVPVDRAIAMSTTYLPHLDALGLVDTLVGLDSFLYVNTPSVVEAIEAGGLVEVGSGSTVSVETVLEAEPDVVFAYGSGVPDYDAHPVLIDAGVPVALNGDFLEGTMLGRAEWVKFTALFYNAEAEANAFFDEVVANYNATVDLVNSVDRDAETTVLWNSFSPYDNAWRVPGANTWPADLLDDAGANLLLSELAPDQSVPVDFETVYAEATGAEVWFVNAFDVNTLDDLLALDARYADFDAVSSGRAYNDNGRVNANGGTDFYETGVARPDMVLDDVVSIVYPELLPDHTLVFFRQLAGA